MLKLQKSWDIRLLTLIAILYIIRYYLVQEEVSLMKKTLFILVSLSFFSLTMSSTASAENPMTNRCAGLVYFSTAISNDGETFNDKDKAFIENVFNIDILPMNKFRGFD